MSQWGFYFNQDRCLGCKTCIVACKQWNESRRGDAHINVMDTENYSVPENALDMDKSYIDEKTGETNYPEYRKYYMKEMWRRLENTDTGKTEMKENNTFSSDFDRTYVSISCNHCINPACLVACPQGLIYKDVDTGAVLYNREGCISCGRCKSACPWGAPQFYDDNIGDYRPNDPNRPKMTKCTLCKDRISEGLKPACVAACWNRALDAGPSAELQTKYPEAVIQVLGFNPGSKTHPNILFKGKTTFRK